MSALTEAAVTGAGAGGGIAGVWAGLRWLTKFIAGRLDKREAALNAREARIDAEEAAQVMALKDRLDKLETVVQAQGGELEKHRIALHILVAKVAREEPAAPELKQVAELLGNSFPLHLHIPPDMADDLSKLK